MAKQKSNLKIVGVTEDDSGVTVVVETPALANSDLTDDERRALFLNSIVKIEREQAKKADLVGPIDAAIKLTRKVMKSEGFDKARVDDALRRRKMEPEAVEAEFKMLVETSKWLGLPIGYEPDLFDVSKDRTPLVERAHADGKIAGMAGEDCKVPEPKYSPESDAGQAWLRGWGDGQAVLLSALAKRRPDDVETKEGGGMPDADAEVA